MIKENYRLSIDNVKAAPRKIEPVFLDTPQFISDTLSELLNLSLVVKVETINPVRCFKGRGSELLVANATAGTHFVCASAGNFGQAMAYSCRKKKLSLTVFASTAANPYKISRMKSLGADVILFGDDFDAAKVEAKRRSAEMNARFVEDSLDIETVEGASTIGLELLKFPEKIDAVLVALGNGALFNGVARIMKHHAPDTKLIAIQARGASAMVDSWRSSTVVSYQRTNTIADGIAVRIPVAQALKDMSGLADDAILVEDGTIIKAMQLIYEHLGIVSEPSGAVGLAALLENPALFNNQRVAIIVCGGNVTSAQRRLWFAT
jgi:threonine dehydratase